MIKELKLLHNAATNELDELLGSILESTDIQSIVEKLLSSEADDIIGDGVSVIDAIGMLITVAQYVETDTTMESIMIDDDYDKLQAKYESVTGKFISGTNGTSGSNRPVAHHRYPELRGSLDKVHFIRNDEIPKKDSRRSLESWLNTSINKCKFDMSKTIMLAHYYKFDGVSGVFECTGNNIDQVLTRKDTDENTGLIITHLFKDKTVNDLFGDIFDATSIGNSKLGIKVEILMKTDKFEEFKSLFVTKPPKNHRSAVSMITNTFEEELNPDWVNYLSIMPVQISSDIELDEDSFINGWYLVGKENGRYQYINASEQPALIRSSIEPFLDMVSEYNDYYISNSQSNNIPIDGVVWTILNGDMVETLGRSDNKNKYQVAYKFAAGVEKSKVTKVTFPVGPVSGLVTPLVEFEPVKIMGNTITTASLSNIDKFERMHIHIGDEIMVKYNIIPTIYKTDDCKESDSPEVKYPTHCPVCGNELSVKVNQESGNRTVRCINPDCPCHIAGKIYNYVNKVKIANIGLKTIEDLICLGVLETIGDLYRIQEHEFRIKSAPGYGETKYNNMVKSINSRLVLYPHELLGGIGIPDMGRRMMKKVCTVIEVDDLLKLDDNLIDVLTKIDGIGEKTAIKICDGLLQNEMLIKDIMRYVELKPYEVESTGIKVLFSKVRDTELERILKEKYNAEIQDSYTKATDLLIVKDLSVTSSKIEKAKKDGKKIMSINQAREEFK